MRIPLLRWIEWESSSLSSSAYQKSGVKWSFKVNARGSGLCVLGKYAGRIFATHSYISGNARCVRVNKIQQACWKWWITNHGSLRLSGVFFKYLDFIKHIHPVDTVVNLVPYHFQFIHHMVALIYEYSVKIQFSWAAIAGAAWPSAAIAPDLLYLPLLKQ